MVRVGFTKPTVVLDIGGTNIRGALIAPSGRLIGKVFHQRMQKLGERSLVMTSAGLVNSLIPHHYKNLEEAASALSISFAGPVDHKKGVVISAPNIEVPDNFPFVQELIQILAANIPILLNNDANCGAMAEAAFGAGKGLPDFLWVTISTGFGGGIIAGGRLVTGATFRGGEIGHVKLGSEYGVRDVQCGCGQTGCAEVFAGNGLVSLALKEQKQNGVDPHYGPNLTAEVIAKKAAEGNSHYLGLLQRSARAIASVLAQYAILYDPTRIFVAGSLGQNSLYFALLKEAFEKQPISFVSQDHQKSLLALSTVQEPCLVGAGAALMYQEA